VIVARMDEVARAAAPHAVAVQERQLGDRDAVQSARGALDGFMGDVLVLYGDCPLIRAETLNAMRAQAPGEAVTVLGIRVPGPSPYGRLVLAGDGTLDGSSRRSTRPRRSGGSISATAASC